MSKKVRKKKQWLTLNPTSLHIAWVSCFRGPMCRFGKSTTFGKSSSIFGLLRILEDSFRERFIDVENRARCSPLKQCRIASWNELDFRFWTRYLVACMRIIFDGKDTLDYSRCFRLYFSDYYSQNHNYGRSLSSWSNWNVLTMAKMAQLEILF